jgi:hypothetical protein
MFFFSIVNNLQSFNFLDYLINSISKNDLNIIFISYAGINLIYFFISFIFKNKIFNRFPTFNMLTSAIELEKINDAPEIRHKFNIKLLNMHEIAFKLPRLGLNGIKV